MSVLPYKIKPNPFIQDDYPDVLDILNILW